MVRIRLDDDFYLKDASVYGIVSELPDYRLCYFLNNTLKLQLTRSAQSREYILKGEKYFFSEFSYAHPLQETMWNLTSNSGYALETAAGGSDLKTDTKTFLVADLKAFDYFLWYEEPANNEMDSLLNKKLKELSYVRTFQKIDLAKSKNINNLLFEY